MVLVGATDDVGGTEGVVGADTGGGATGVEVVGAETGTAT